MKVKMFFLIFLMNVTSYLGRGECNCCECLENCWGDKKKVNNMVPEVNEMNVENEPEVNEMNVENEKENSEIKNKGPRDFVNKTWLEEKKKQENFVLRLFDKTEKDKYKSEDIEIELKEDKEKTVIKDSDEVKEALKTDTRKWALFEIKTGDNETHYLYCSDIESKKVGYSWRSIFETRAFLLSISVLASDIINVKSMNSMFYECFNLETLDLFKFNTSRVTDMCYMFENCYKLQTLDLSSFDTSNVQKMFGMFKTCPKLQTLDLSNFFLKNDINLSSDAIMKSLDDTFLDNTHALKLIYFKNEQVAKFISAYCRGNISLDSEYALNTKKYEYYYDQEKNLHCVKITEKN